MSSFSYPTAKRRRRFLLPRVVTKSYSDLSSDIRNRFQILKLGVFIDGNSYRVRVTFRFMGKPPLAWMRKCLGIDSLCSRRR